MILFRSTYKKNIINEHVSTFITIPIKTFNRGFTVQIASNCRHLINLTLTVSYKSLSLHFQDFNGVKCHQNYDMYCLL